VRIFPLLVKCKRDAPASKAHVGHFRETKHADKSAVARIHAARINSYLSCCTLQH